VSLKLKLVKLAILAAALGPLAVMSAKATPPEIVRPFGIDIRPISLPARDGPATLSLRFGPPLRHWGETIRVTVTTDGGLVYHGLPTFEVSFTDSLVYLDTLEVTILPDEISCLKVTLRCGEIDESAYYTFITLSDSLESSRGRPSRRSRDRESSSEAAGENRRLDFEKDTLTHEQLQLKYPFVIFLTEPGMRELVEGVLGPLPDSAICPGADGKDAYFMDIRLKDAFYLHEHGVTVVVISHVPPRIQDSLGIKGKYPDALVH
jgi:hypothetical protein